MTTFRFLLVVCFAGLLLGCGRQEKTVFAVVDGWPLDVPTVKDAVLLKARIGELSGRPIKKDRFAHWANNCAMRLIPRMIASHLWENEIDRIGLKADPEDEAVILRGYNKLARKTAKSADELAPVFGELAPAFLRQFARETLFQAYNRKVIAAEATDAEMARFLRAKTNDFERAKRIDERARKNGAAAWARLNAGEEWKIVAAACSEDPLESTNNVEYAWEWMVTKPQNVLLDELKPVLPAMGKGAYTKPIETEEGLLIVKVMDIDEGGVYTLARMMFRMAVPVEIPSRERARREIVSDKIRTAQEELSARLRAAAKIDLPMGTNFVYRIWEEPTNSVKRTIWYNPKQDRRRQ